MMSYGMGGWGFGGIHMLVGAIVWIAILVFVVWVVVRLVSPQTHIFQTPSSHTAPPASSALDILKIRYARGEITKADYDQMKQDLS